VSLLDDVIDFLEDEGLVNDSGGWTAFAGTLPPSPDRSVAVFETPGMEPETVKDGSAEVAYDRPGFQVRIRGDEHGYEAMRDRLGAIFRALHGTNLAGVTTGSSGYLQVWAVQSGPMPMGEDHESRPGATWNFRTWRERG
jgi:minor capsid protein